MYRIAASCLLTALLVTALITGCEPESVSGDDEEQQGEWRLEIIDDGGNVGRAPAVALDENGCPHVAYCSVDPPELRYARRTNGYWNYGCLVSIGLSQGTSIAVDDGLPFIAYIGGGLSYLYWGGDDWKTETVDRACNCPSLVRDDAGAAHIAYQDPTAYDLKCARQTAMGWELEILDIEGLTGFYTSLGLDSAGRPCIAYHRRDSDEVKLAVYDGNDWTSEVVDEGTVCDLAVDDRDGLHLAYYAYPERVLLYAYNDGGGWQFETIDEQMGNYGIGIDIDVTSEGEPRVAYIDADRGLLNYAFPRGDGWAVSVADSDSVPDCFVALAVDGQDRPHIVYRSDNSLRYAIKDQ
ncbi:MAG: hypothetical protein GF399_08910 [Candidatus Coatesbacteria bacterium]|nr:hypothetical protein [Candidatus Coatesbacteria bacterium]